jgi:type II secretory pathway component PulJ
MHGPLSHPHRRRGQTMLELLTVVGIILVLMSMLLVAVAKIYRVVIDMKGG